jgi:membrane protein DedA with SNARE-associated domain
LWSAAFVLLGFAFWQSFDEAVAIAKQGSLALGAVVLLVVALIAGYRRLRDRTDRGAGRPRSGPRAGEAEEPSAHAA